MNGLLIMAGLLLAYGIATANNYENDHAGFALTGALVLGYFGMVAL